MLLVVSFEVAATDVIALSYCELPPTETTSSDQLKPKNSIDKVTSISWLPNRLKGGKFMWPSTFMLLLLSPQRMNTILVSQHAHATLLKITFIRIVTVDSFSVS